MACFSTVLSGGYCSPGGLLRCCSKRTRRRRAEIHIWDYTPNVKYRREVPGCQAEPEVYLDNSLFTIENSELSANAWLDIRHGTLSPENPRKTG